MRAEVGTRLHTIDGAQETLADRKVELESATSQLRDLDYAEAVSRMNQQLVGLQAAQASYSKIAQLSLFDYLR
jgi:flagellar hook-associated protein 3 FlgL